MLIFTTRELESSTDESAFEPHFSASSARVALANLERAPEAMTERWKVSQAVGVLDDAHGMRTWLPLFQKPGPLLVYLHGYNDTLAACVERCDRLQSVYGLEVVRFSWSSKKYLVDYGAPTDFDLQRELAPFLGARHGLPSQEHPMPPDAVAQGLDRPDCSWWLVMALTGSPASQGA